MILLEKNSSDRIKNFGKGYASAYRRYRKKGVICRNNSPITETNDKFKTYTQLKKLQINRNNEKDDKNTSNYTIKLKIFIINGQWRRRT